MTKTTNTKAEALKEAYKEEALKRLNNSIKWWNSEDCHNLKNYLTPKKAEAYEVGTLSRSEAVELAKARELKTIHKDIEKTNNKIDEIFNASEVQTITISVNWVRSKTWGYNPHAVATIRTTSGACYEYEGSASGCGYDKQSASIAEALNQSNNLLKHLYEEKAEKLDKDNRNALGYGSGYGVLPHFEGGVGVSCHINIMEALGFELIANQSTNTSNFYYFNYTGNKKPVRAY